MEQATTLMAGWANDILVWVGFGTIIGLVAKGIMPGKDPGGSIATLGTGVGGTIIGCGIFSFFVGSRVTPISAAGFLVATFGAFVILFFYRMLAGYYFEEGETNLKIHHLMRRRKRTTKRAA